MTHSLDSTLVEPHTRKARSIAARVSEEVRATAATYLPWAALTPVLGVVCFQFDGIFTGAMATRDMRNMMIVSLAIFMLAWWFLEAPFGNHGLWAALNIFFVARAVSFASRNGGGFPIWIFDVPLTPQNVAEHSP
mgnify:CR=1 FL=1